jgi:alanine racemase
MAMAAARALVDEINGYPAPHSEYVFRPELVVRASTAVVGARALPPTAAPLEDLSARVA